jgi:hypothetical protein
MSAADSSRPGGDDLLRRIERRILWLTAVACGVALVVPGGGVRLAVAVLGGAILSLASYLAIKWGIGGLVDAAERRAEAGERRKRAPRGLAWLVVRYALLAGIAYVMIARLRLSPLGLLGGVSVTVLAAAGEIVRRPR